MICKRNGGEHAWSFFRNSRAFDISSTKEAECDGRLSDVGICCDQSPRWQKLAAIPEEIFEREVPDKVDDGWRDPYRWRAELNSAAAECLRGPSTPIFRPRRNRRADFYTDTCQPMKPFVRKDNAYVVKEIAEWDGVGQLTCLGLAVDLSTNKKRPFCFWTILSMPPTLSRKPK